MVQDTPRQAMEGYLRRSSRKAAVELILETVRRSIALRKPIALKVNDVGKRFNALNDYRVAVLPSNIFVKDGDKYYPPETGERGRGGGPYPVLRTRSFDHFDLCMPDVDDPNYLSSVEDWCRDIRQRCKKALTAEAGKPPVRYVVFGELSFPNFWAGRPRAVYPRWLSSSELRRRLERLRDQLDQDMQTLATENSAVVISGSYHDPTTFENLACIYFPCANDTMYHSKLTSAQTVGEYVKTARGVTYPIYNIGEAKFSVLICSDAFDLNIFFEQLCKPSNNPDIRPDIYFVPSFHVPEPGKRNQMLAACRQLSHATGRVVVFVNQRQDPNCVAAFIGGQSHDAAWDESVAFLDLRVPHVKAEMAKSEEMRITLDGMLRRSGTHPRQP